MSYTVWAVRLTKHFFGPQFAKQRVRLMVTRDVLDHTFADIGGTNAFIDAVRKSGPEWLVGNQPLHDRGLVLNNQWNRQPEYRSQDYPKKLVALKDVPPFLPYLCLLCLAWTEGEGQNLEPNDFYGRLDLLYPNHGLEQHLGDWKPLWKGLEDWTERHNKKWGHFVTELLGQMKHVGIPKSQVILTPSKVARLPELWSACNLQPDSQVPANDLKTLLCVQSQVASRVLGYSVYDAISEGDALGDSALQLLSEYLENWDGIPPEGTEAGVNGERVRAAARSVVLILRPLCENTEWALSFGVEDDRECESFTFPDRNWALHSVDAQLAILRNSQGQDVAVSTMGPEWVDGETIRGRWKEESGLEEEVRLKLAPTTGVRIFERWVGCRLVESTALSTHGGVYALVSPQVKNRWDHWKLEFAHTNPIQNFTWPGLPAGWYLLYLGAIERLSQSARLNFPSSQALVSNRPLVLRLVGGTRARSNAPLPIYASYDPPTLILRGERSVAIEVEGAGYQETSTNNLEVRLPGDVERSYALTIKPSASSVIVTAIHDGRKIGTKMFGVLPESPVAGLLASTAVPSMNSFGESCAEAGVHGAIIPDMDEQWSFDVAVQSSNSTASQGSENHRAFDLLESLDVGFNDGRMTFPEFRRRAFKITGIESWHFYQETRWLAQLGFVEIQTDQWGRWSHINRNPFQLYTLPYSSNGKREAVLTGCGSKARRKSILKMAELFECELKIVHNGCKLVPPRITLLHRELAAFEMLADELHLEFGAQPACLHLAKWSSSLQEWLEHLRWHSQEGTREIAEYVPTSFRLTAEATHKAPYRLMCVEDPYTRSHRWHKLLHNDAIHDGGLRHAFVRDSAWGMWKTQNSIADEDFTVLAYDEFHMMLVVPIQLFFPYLLGRALSLCSGRVPDLIYNHPAYADQTLEVLPAESPSYTGACWCYSDVPRRVAEIVASKVSAELKILSPLNP